MKDVRCNHCGKKLAIAAYIEIQIKCTRCKTINHFLRADEPLNQSVENAGEGGNNGQNTEGATRP